MCNELWLHHRRLQIPFDQSHEFHEHTALSRCDCVVNGGVAGIWECGSTICSLNNNSLCKLGETLLILIRIYCDESFPLTPSLCCFLTCLFLVGLKQSGHVVALQEEQKTRGRHSPSKVRGQFRGNTFTLSLICTSTPRLMLANNDP